jgi:hypothetical protein
VQEKVQEVQEQVSGGLYSYFFGSGRNTKSIENRKPEGKAGPGEKDSPRKLEDTKVEETQDTEQVIVQQETITDPHMETESVDARSAEKVEAPPEKKLSLTSYFRRQDSLITDNDDNKFKLNVIFQLKQSSTVIQQVNDSSTDVEMEVKGLVVCFERHHKNSKFSLRNRSVRVFEQTAGSEALDLLTLASEERWALDFKFSATSSKEHSR